MHEPVIIPNDMPPIHSPQHQMDTRPPTWNEVEKNMKHQPLDQMLYCIEKNASSIGQFCQISQLNVEGRIFFSVLAQRLSTFLQRNNNVDTSVQKAGIQGISGI